MPKRTAADLYDKDKSSEKAKVDDDIEFSDSDEDENSGEDIINVDFDFFDLNPDVDFHGLRTFMKQLFGDDYKRFDLSGLANIILDPKNTAIGSSVKTDGKEGDPLALLALLSLKNYKSHQPLNSLIDYIVRKSQGNSELYITLKKILAMNGGEKVGLIINERIINVPVEVTPPLFKFMLEEASKQEPQLEYFIIISKVYKLVASQISDDSDSEDEGPKRTKKVKKNSENQEEFDYFHMEDAILEQHSLLHDKFKYDDKLQDTDSRRVFTEYGIDPHLSLIVMKKSGLEKAVPQLETDFAVN